MPFEVTIPKSEQDKNLVAKLRKEWPGILAWAVRGCLDWQREGLAEPDEVRAATGADRAEQDTLQGFIEDCCLVHREAKVVANALLDAYQKWSGDKSMTPNALRVKLNDKGFHSQRGTGGYSFYHGIGLNSAQNEGASDGE